MIKMRITESMIKLAKEWSQVQADYFNANAHLPNPNHIQEPDRYFKGYLGELALYNYFYINNKAVTHYVHLTCKSAKPDFIYTSASGHETIIDSKANVINPNYTNPSLLVFERAYDESLLYVAVDLDPYYKYANLIGMCRGSELRWNNNIGKKPQGRYIKSYKTLTPMESLVYIIPEGKTTREIIR